MVNRIVERFHPWRVILFGSHARGDARSDSDFDLLIVAPSDKPRWRRTAPVYRLLAGLGAPKDIILTRRTKHLSTFLEHLDGQRSCNS